MEQVNRVLAEPWVAVVLFLIGAGYAYYFYIKSRLRPKMSFQASGTNLIGIGSELAGKVTVTVQGKVVPRLTSTEIIFWNSGNITFRNADIVASDPLKLQLQDSANVVAVEMIRQTREVTGVQLHLVPDAQNTVLVDFDFLDPGDGARLKIFHTGESGEVDFRGTLRGLPNGFDDLGSLSLSSRRKRAPLPRGRYGVIELAAAQTIDLLLTRPKFLFACLVLTLLPIFLAGLFPDVVLKAFPSLAKSDSALLIPGQINWPLVISAGVVIVPYIAMLWREIRRYPKSLDAISAR